MKKQSKLTIGMIAGVLLVAVVIIVALLMTSSNTGRNYQKHMETAQQYMDELQYERAIAEYEAAIEIEPSNAEIYQALAEAYIAIGDYESAVDVLERGVVQTGSEELEVYKSDALEIVYSFAEPETDTESIDSGAGANNSGEEDSASEPDSFAQQETAGEADIPEENIAQNEEQQNESGTVTILITWDDRYDDGSLVDLDVDLTGTKDDGTELSFDEDMQWEEEQGSIQVTLYRTDGVYNLTIEDGFGFAMHGTNGLPDSTHITLIDAEGKSIQIDVEASMYRSYTGLWFLGIGIDHGMLADYDSSWISEQSGGWEPGW